MTLAAAKRQRRAIHNAVVYLLILIIAFVNNYQLQGIENHTEAV